MDKWGPMFHALMGSVGGWVFALDVTKGLKRHIATLESRNHLSFTHVPNDLLLST